MSLENGRKIYMQRCAVCHTLEAGGKHKSGPNLHGFMGKKGGQAAGYKFSNANKAIGVWTDEKLDEFLENPKKLMPGTTMLFPGLKSASDRKDLIYYLKTAT